MSRTLFVFEFKKQRCEAFNNTYRITFTKKIRLKKSYIFFLLFLFSFGLFQAQVTNEGKPKSWSLELISPKALSLPGFNLKSLKSEDKNNDRGKDKPYRFGYEHQVSLGLEDGKWNRLKNGDKVWLLNIQSKGAKTLNFLFDEYNIPKGAKLYFYNEDKTDLLGAYTSSQNREDRQFGSWLIGGDNIWIEYFEPANAEFKGRLHISKVVHGYRSVMDITELSKVLNDSGSCNQDVDCPVGTDFENIKDQLKKSVAMTIVGNSGFCSGTLINNTNNDGAQYFLTANHCLGSSPGNWAFRFDWRSPDPSCSTTTNSTNGAFNQTVSGATLLANNSKSDFALLQLDAPLPTDWDLVWAGWDRSGNIPDFTVGIHHPRGDIMKISRDDDSPTKKSSAFNDIDDMDNWFLDDWELGVTEPGSSGSALFDQNGRIIGQLAGGTAACVATLNNGEFDIYGRFGVSWDYGDTPGTRLKEWLDPSDTGALVLDQYPPTQVFDNDVALLVENLSNTICSDKANPVFSIFNKGNGVVTRATLTYQFENEPEAVVEWTGSLSLGERDEISSPLLTLNSDNILNASLTIIGIKDEFPTNNFFYRVLDNFQDATYDAETVTLTLLTDDYASETSWEFYDQDGILLKQSQGTLTDNTTYTETFDVDPNSCYEFVLLDSEADGICCKFGNGSYSLQTDKGEIIIKGDDFGGIESSSFRVSNGLSSTRFDVSSGLMIYPNPASTFVQIETKSNEQFNLELFDMSGKRLYQTEMIGKASLDLNAYSTGIYFIKIGNASMSITKKILKQ
jgi:hypothetical protein